MLVLRLPDELQCQYGSLLLVLAQKSSRLMMSASLELSPASLTMVAPNTLYPMFIVAPGERRNRVREQLARPSFRHLGIQAKVRYLSYEKVNEIEEFFGESKSGLGVDVIVGKSEACRS